MGDGADYPEPSRLRQLRWLVTALTLTLIVGVITIVALLVVRLGPVARGPQLPHAIRLPAGESARAVTLGGDRLAVVTVDAAGRERIRLIEPSKLLQYGSSRVTAVIAPRRQ